MGKRLDDAIGRIVTTLKAEGVWENTILFFISDNGGPLAQSADNTPLTGGKHQDYEGGVRVPSLVCWPAKLKPGESESVVSSLDFRPTVIAATGATALPEKPFGGLDLVPLLRVLTTTASRNLYWCSGSEEGWWAVRPGKWKLVSEKGNIHLFDLGQSAAEEVDLAAEHPDKIAELTALHDAWLAEMSPPISGEGKRYGMEPATEGKPKKPKSERKKNKKKKWREPGTEV